METTNITNARANLFKLAQAAVESHEPITLTSKSGDVVLISKEDYDAMQETLYLQTNKGLAKDIKRLNDASDDEFVSRDDLQW